MLSAILHSLCGFYLQLVPCTFFCLYPFLDRFRYPRKRVIAAICGAMVVMSVIFTYVYVVMDIPSGIYDSFLPLNLIFLLTVALLTGIYLFCIWAAPIHMLYTVILVLNYGFLISMLGDWFIPEDYLYNTNFLLAQLLSTALLFYPMLHIMRLARSAFDSPIGLNVWKWFTLIPGLFFATMLLCYQIPMSGGLSAEKLLDIIIRALCVLMPVICAIILRTIQTMQQQANKQASLEIAVNHYKLLAEHTDKERELRHEFRHHMNALSILIQNQDYEGAENYLNKLSQIEVAEATEFYTPHMLLNSMLSGYKKRAAEAGIQTDYTIEVMNSVSIEDLDLCQFLSNMLDNALEANSHLETAKRRLSLTIRQKGNFLYFRCENPCDPAWMHPTNNEFKTTKSNALSHGYGIAIMKRITEKYAGDFRTDVQNNIFTVTGYLCM